MQGKGQLDHTEIRGEMAPIGRHLVDDEGADLLSQRLELIRAQPAEVGRARDGFEYRHVENGDKPAIRLATARRCPHRESGAGR